MYARKELWNSSISSAEERRWRIIEFGISLPHVVSLGDWGESTSQMQRKVEKLGPMEDLRKCCRHSVQYIWPHGSSVGSVTSQKHTGQTASPFFVPLETGRSVNIPP